MKRWICMLLLVGLLALPGWASASARLTEATMIYEDYDGNHADWTVNDEDELAELEDMLQRAKDNRAQPDNCTMNCTLLCRAGNETVVAFEVATDGCPFVTEMNRGVTYSLNEDDWARLWQIFEQIQEAMGYDASQVLDW